MDEIIDKLARECAEHLIAVQQYYDTDSYYVTFWPGAATDDGLFDSMLGNKDRITTVARTSADRLTDAVADAIHRFARTPPHPSPVSEERLTEITQAVAKAKRFDRVMGHEMGYAERCCSDLLTHCLHLTRLVQAMSAESEGRAYAAGYDAGRRSGAADQRAADKATLGRMPAGSVARAMFQAIRGAPLVTETEPPDPEGKP